MWVFGVKNQDIENLYDSEDGPPGTKDRLAWVTSQFGRVGIVEVEGERAYVGAKNVKVEIEKMGNRVTLTEEEGKVRVFEGRMSPDLKIYVNGQQAQVSSFKPQAPRLPKMDMGRMVEKVKMGLSYHHDPDGGKKLKKTIYIGLGFLVFGGILFGIGGFRRAETDLKKSADFQEVESMWGEFQSAKGDVNKLQNLKLRAENFSGKDFEDRVKTIKEQIPTLIEEAYGVKRVELTELIDLGLVREGMRVFKMTLIGGNIWGLDTSLGRLVNVDIKKKSGTVVAGSDVLGKPVALASYPGRVVIFGDKGGVQCDVGNAKCKQVITLEQMGENPLGIGMFAGNIYGVDTAGEIWRYAVLDTGYGPKVKWIGEDQEKVSGVAGLAIDGSIWLMTQPQIPNLKSQISKYTRGVKDAFSITGLDQELGTRSVVFTSDELEKLYILDPEKERIVTLDKTGKYESQVKNSLLKDATDLVVDDEEVIYIAVGSKIYEIGE